MRDSSKNSIAGLLQEKLLPEFHTTDVPAIADRIRTFDRIEQNIILNTCEKILSDEKAPLNEVNRVACVKILISLLPLSMPTLERLLKKRKGKEAYEIHFTIFCFLDRVICLHVNNRTSSLILDAVSEYLHNVSSETASAAWMAGDLLGDHWKSKETFDILLSAAQNGRYVAGRLAAIYGLEQRIKGTTPNSHLRKRALQILHEVSSSDRSCRVRVSACYVVGKR
jgi:hypothetical protein